MTNIDLNPVDLKCNKKDKAKVLIVQPQIKENQLNLGEGYCYRLELNHNDKAFIDQVLKESIKNQVDVVVFPEFSVPFTYHHVIKEFSKQNHNIFIVAGTDYLKRDEEYYNTASIFFNGNHYYTDKCRLSPHEKSILYDRGPKGGNKLNYFVNSPAGNIAIMICMDALDKEIRDKHPIKDIDILCVISFQKKPYDHHQAIDQIVKSCKNIYVAYANCSCPSLSGGRSSFFSKNFEDKSKQSHQIGLSKQDGITWRAIEMPEIAAGCLIVECNLENKNIVNIADSSDDRSLISIHGIYYFENESLARYEPITTHHKKDDKLPDEKNNDVVKKDWKEDTISKINKIASTWKDSRMSHKEWLRQYRYIQKNNKNQSIPREYKNIYKDYEYVLRKDYISGDCQGRNNNYLIESLKDYSETIDIYLECTNYIEYAAIIYMKEIHKIECLSVNFNFKKSADIIKFVINNNITPSAMILADIPATYLYSDQYIGHYKWAGCTSNSTDIITCSLPDLENLRKNKKSLIYVEDERLLTTSKFLAHSIERKFRLRKPKDIILQPDDAITTFQTSEEAAAILFGSHASLFENPHLIQDIDDKIPNIAISIYTESNFMNLNISEAFLYCFFDTIRGLRTNDNKRNIVLDSIKKDELYLNKVAATLGLI